MSFVTALVLYVLIWWVVLFVVLPFGVKPVADAHDVAGGWRGAPEQVFPLRTLAITTAVAACLWAGAMTIIVHKDWLSFRSGWLSFASAWRGND